MEIMDKDWQSCDNLVNSWPLDALAMKFDISSFWDKAAFVLDVAFRSIWPCTIIVTLL